MIFKKKCKHDWMFLGPMWIKENQYQKVYMCRKCFKKEGREIYEVLGRKRVIKK